VHRFILVSVASLVYFTTCVSPTVVIMSSQPTVVAQPVVVDVLCGWCLVWRYVVGGSGTTQQCTMNTKNTVLYTTVAYATHSGSYSTERKKEVHRLHTGTQQLQWYTTFTAVHSTCMTQKHLGLPERQVASTMISVLILSSRH